MMQNELSENSTKATVKDITTGKPLRIKFLGQVTIGPTSLQMHTQKFPVTTSARYSIEGESCNPYC
jgi:hypothetical protein